MKVLDFRGLSPPESPSPRSQSSPSSPLRSPRFGHGDDGDHLDGFLAASAGQASGLLGLSSEEVLESLQVVSLGCYCGVKASMMRLGLGAGHMPFDWIRTSSRGVMHWLQNGFSDFFEVDRMLQVTLGDSSMTVFRSEYHSFWHDDVDDPKVRVKLQRRIDRFHDLGERDVLFVRSVAGSPELADSEEMFSLLQRFEKGETGRRVFLLLILEDQPVSGLIAHETMDRLLFWVQPQFQGSLSMDSPAPFEEAITHAVRHILGKSEDVLPKVAFAGALMTPAFVLDGTRMRDTTSGIWSGHVQVEGEEETVPIAAFEGYDNLVGECRCPPKVPKSQTASSVRMRSKRGG